MHVRRQLNRFFGSFRWRKPREKSVRNDLVDTPLSAQIQASVFGRSKEYSLSRCQLLVDEDDPEPYYYCDDDALDSLNPENNHRFPYEKPSDEIIQLPGVIEVQVELCHSQSQSSFNSLSSTCSSSIKSEQTESYGADNQIFVAEDSCDDEKYHEMSLPHPIKESYDTKQESADDTTRSSSTKSKEANKTKKMMTGNKGTLVLLNIAKFPGLRFTMMEWRKSAKRFRKAVKSGFVDWAESMSHYSVTVIPELYECPHSTPSYTDYGDSSRYETSAWFYRHPHYHTEQRCHREALQANHVNRVCQMGF